MVPKIHRSGSNFKGVTAYLSHDQGKAKTTERVAWTMTGNLRTNDIEKASRIMAFTALNAEEIKRESGISSAGRKSAGKPVSHHSLSWGLDENPSPEHMKRTALDYIKSQGAEDHQYYIIAHNETDHRHVHIVMNLVSPSTGKLLDTGFSKNKASRWALEYEKQHGILCQKRLDNHEKRKDAEYIKHQEQKQDYRAEVTLSFQQSDNGKSFMQALKEKGLQLANGRRGNVFLIVDNKGDIQKLSRQLDIEQRGKKKSDAIQKKLADLDREKLSDGESLARQIREAQQTVEVEKENGIEDKRKEQIQKDLDKPVVWDRDKANQAWQDSIDKAGIEAEKQRDYNRKKKQQTEKSQSTGSQKTGTDQQSPGSYAAYLDKHQARQAKEDRQRSQLDRTIDQTYTRKETEAKLRQAMRRLEKTNTWFGRRSGKYAKALEEAEGYRKTLDNIAMRENELRGALEQKLQAHRIKDPAQEQDNQPSPNHQLDKTFNASGNDDRDARAEEIAPQKDRDRGGYER